MAKLDNLSTAAVLLLVVATMATAIKAGVNSAGGPSPKEILSDAYYETCKSKIGRDCGLTIVSEMFFKNATAGAPCCRKLLTMGKNCHANLLGKILQRSPFKENKALALERSRALLARCSLH